MDPAYKFELEQPIPGKTVLCRLHTGTGIVESMLITALEKYPNGRWTAYGFNRYGDIEGIECDAKVFLENHWKPLDWVKDGSQNVFRPRGLEWKEGKFVKTEASEEDNGGIPDKAKWPKPQSNESQSDWWRRCKNMWPQLDGRDKAHKALKDEIWEAHLERVRVG